jgi:hypothetical protein
MIVANESPPSLSVDPSSWSISLVVEANAGNTCHNKDVQVLLRTRAGGEVIVRLLN